jgi:hypothetical protein
MLLGEVSYSRALAGYRIALGFALNLAKRVSPIEVSSSWKILSIFANLKTSCTITFLLQISNFGYKIIEISSE